jgi:hypothetical protein
MTTNTNTDSATLNELLDDLLWLYSRIQTHAGGLETAVHAMIAEYTANPDHYSDGRLSVRSTSRITRRTSSFGGRFLRRIAAPPRRIHRRGQQRSTGTSWSTFSACAQRCTRKPRAGSRTRDDGAN